MFLELIIGAVVTVVAAGILDWFEEYIDEKNRIRSTLPQITEMPDVELNEYDAEILQGGASLMREFFADGIPQTLRGMDAEERVEYIRRFAEELAVCCGLGEDEVRSIHFLPEDDSSMTGLAGYYSSNDKAVYINQTRLCIDLMRNVRIPNEQYIDDMLIDTVDTVIHELRHAFQLKAITEMTNGKDYSAYELKGRVKKWYDNYTNYVSSSDNLKAYYNQPIEKDARAFAAIMIRLYMNKEN